MLLLQAPQEPVVLLGDAISPARRACRHAARCQQLARWEVACTRALAWSLHWAHYAPPHVIELGEDVLALVTSSHDLDLESWASMASTCRCLRGLILPRLEKAKAKALRDIYLVA